MENKVQGNSVFNTMCLENSSNFLHHFITLYRIQITNEKVVVGGFGEVAMFAIGTCNQVIVVEMEI